MAGAAEPGHVSQALYTTSLNLSNAKGRMPNLSSPASARVACDFNFNGATRWLHLEDRQRPSPVASMHASRWAVTQGVLQAATQRDDGDGPIALRAHLRGRSGPAGCYVCYGGFIGLALANNPGTSERVGRFMLSTMS